MASKDTSEVVGAVGGCGCLTIALLVKLAILGGLCYAAYHFATKYW